MVKSSINIKYDINNSDLVSGYYATSSHTMILSNVMKSLNGKNKQNAIVAYGPYGAGKSYVSALLLGIATGAFSKKDNTLLKNKLRVVDEENADVMYSMANSNRKIVPVIISGIEGDFRSTLLNNVNRALIKNQVNVVFPGITSEILNTIKRWKKSYQSTYTEFLFELSDKGFQEDEFYDKLKTSDEQSIELFENIYTKLTAGSKYHANFNSSIDETLLNICNQLELKNYSLMIVWDEFGRVLQNLHLTEINQFMQEIQDIAELANNGVKNLTTLFVAHKPLGFYLNFATKELRDEFAKVEKRFKVIEIKSDYVTFLQITSEVLKQYNIKQELQSDDFIALRKYNVFSSYLNDTELQNLVFNSSYPLHPITLYALPKLSSIFGQNERSLFSFLYDESTNGLVGYLKYSKEYYYVDRLVDFFFTNIEKSYVEEIELYNIYKTNVTRINVVISENVEESKRLYKFAMVWRLINGNHVLKLSSNFISYALGINLMLVEQILTELSAAKLMRYNSIHDEWEIFKGSNLDLDKEIAIVKSRINITKESLIELFNNKNPYKYIYSVKHNAINEITRFATMFLHSDTNIVNAYTDAEIVLYFADEEIKKSSRSDVTVHLDYSYHDIKDTLTNLFALKYIVNNEFYKREYPGLEVDTEYKMTLLNRDLNLYFNKIFDSCFKDQNGVLEIQNLAMLEEYFSHKFDSKFTKHPIIINDQLNMYKISSVQFNAFSKVLDNIINSNQSLGDIYSGSSPADLIYKSVIENINLIEKNKAVIRSLKKTLKKHLSQNNNGRLIDLVKILTEEPFGIRPYVAYLLLFELIKDEWNDMLLFIGDTYIPNIDTNDLIDYIVNQPEILKYSFSVFDNKNREYLEELEIIFTSNNDLIRNKSLSIRVCSNMYGWYMNLPTVTQQGINMSISNKAFMDIIKSSRSNPTLAIEKLMGEFEVPDIRIFKDNITNHFGEYIARFNNSIMNKIGTNDLMQWALSQNNVNKKTNRLVNGLLKGHSIFEIYLDETDNLEISKWTKSSFDMLKNLILEDYKKLDEDFDVDTVIVNGKEKFVQKVELSTKGTVTYKNILNLISATSQYLTDSEIEKIVLSLVDKYIS